MKEDDTPMFRKLIRELGFIIIANAAFFTPLTAAAEDGDAVLGAIIGFPAGAVITGVALVSMSHQKKKATKADNYAQHSVDMHAQTDVYVRTTKN